MTYSMLRTTDSNVEIDTPSVSVRPTRQGSFRISVNDAGETEVSARGGDVEVFSPQGSQWVHSGQTLMARGTDADAEFQIVASGGPDDWDRWSDSRDNLITQSVSSRYVGSGVYGAEDLDSAGTWSNVPEYGNVWHPTAVAADWAPYQSGRWVWEDWYGWTWVSYDPWGWAPYHYGRWFHNDSLGWCWYPGLIGARHYWSPALVGFFGFGGGGGIGFGFGNIGWVPLAPYEVFHPWWGRGYYGNRGFNRNINITNVNIINNYRNSRYHNGVTAIGTNDFQNGRFRNITRTSGDRIHNVGAIRGQMPFTGGRANQRFSDRQATVVPRSNGNTRFFTHQQPNPVGRGGAGRSGAAGVQAGGRQNQRGGPGNGQQNSVAARAAGQPGQSNRVAQSGQETGGWRRFGSPSTSGQPSTGRGSQPQARGNSTAGGRQVGAGEAQRGADRPASGSRATQPAAPSSGSRGGWQRFGSPSGGAGTPAPRQSSPAAPRQEYRASPSNNDRPSYGAGTFNRQQSLRIAPPTIRERPSNNETRRQPSAPSYSAPRQSAPRQSAPSYSAPRQSAPRYTAPRQSAPRQSAPSYSAPRQSAPRQSAPSYSAPRQSAPRYSAPRQSAPRQAAPRQSAPAQRGSSAPRGGGGRRR